MTRAHGMLLDGRFPHLNPHQHLGEPLHAAMQCGALYLPYTLCLLLTKLLGLPTAAFPLVSAAVHGSASSWGWMRLLERVGVRSELAATAAIGAGLGGFGLIWAPLWLFTAPVLALLPWIAWTTVACIEAPSARSTGGLALALAAVLFVGYPTWGVYAWLFGLVVAVTWAAGRGAIRSVLRAAPGFLLGGLLAAPFLLPALLFLRSTPRAEALAAEEVLRRAASPTVLLDLLLPVLHHANGFIGPRISVHLHVAGWLVPGLLLAWWLRRRADTPLRAALVTGSAVGLGFLLLSFGRLGGLLPLTLWVPVWSSFRWPFKFLPFALAGLVIVGAVGLELVARTGDGRGRVASLVGAVGAVTGLVVQGLLFADPRTTGVTFGSGFGVLAAGTGLMGLILAGAVHDVRARRTLLLLAPVHALLLVGLTQVWGARAYLAPWGQTPAEVLGIDEDHRILPLSEFPFSRTGQFEQYAVGHSASANGWSSATGTKTEGLMPSWYLDVLPTDHLGLVRPEVSRPLVASSLLRGLAVRWYAVGRGDAAMVRFLTEHPALRTRNLMEESGVFEDPGALPRAWVARRVLPLTDETMAALRTSQLPPDVALVPDLDAERSPARPASLLDSWVDGQDARFTVDAPDGGVLVFAMTWSPGWQAAVDGSPARVLRVNGLACGVALPPGATRVEMRYRTAGLGPGFALAGLALFGWLGLLLRERRG